MSTRTVWVRIEGTSLPLATMRILPSSSSFNPNGGAPQPISIWPDITCVNVAGCAAGRRRLRLDAELARRTPSTTLLDVEPLVE